MLSRHQFIFVHLPSGNCEYPHNVHLPVLMLLTFSYIHIVSSALRPHADLIADTSRFLYLSVLNSEWTATASTYHWCVWHVLTFRFMTTCSLADGSRRFRYIYCLHLLPWMYYKVPSSNLVTDTSLPEAIVVFLGVETYQCCTHQLGHNRFFQTFKIRR